MAEEFDTGTTLHLLSEIEQDGLRSQRSFASRVGIAVGLTNAYMRRCIRKGWIKMSRAPARRYAYYLTPKGLAEKSRLTAEYLAFSFRFFREAREQCLAALRDCERLGRRRIALYGTGELAEIAALAVRETEVVLVGVADPDAETKEHAGLPLRAELERLPAFDAVLVTDIRDPQGVYDRLRERLPAERILTPPLLRVSRNGG